jgi:hypothetical protein
MNSKFEQMVRAARLRKQSGPKSGPSWAGEWGAFTNAFEDSGTPGLCSCSCGCDNAVGHNERICSNCRLKCRERPEAPKPKCPGGCTDGWITGPDGYDALCPVCKAKKGFWQIAVESQRRGQVFSATLPDSVIAQAESPCMTIADLWIKLGEDPEIGEQARPAIVDSARYWVELWQDLQGSRGTKGELKVSELPGVIRNLEEMKVNTGMLTQHLGREAVGTEIQSYIDSLIELFRYAGRVGAELIR